MGVSHTFWDHLTLVGLSGGGAAILTGAGGGTTLGGLVLASPIPGTPIVALAVCNPFASAVFKNVSTKSLFFSISFSVIPYLLKSPKTLEYSGPRPVDWNPPSSV